jgi:hypothetical protein
MGYWFYGVILSDSCLNDDDIIKLDQYMKNDHRCLSLVDHGVIIDTD